VQARSGVRPVNPGDLVILALVALLVALTLRDWGE
jgi:hypothetical protein